MGLLDIFKLGKYREGRVYLDLEMVDKAGEFFEQVVRKDPNDINAWYYFAESCFRIGELSKAREAFLRITKLNPSNDLIKRICDLIGRRRLVSNCFYNNFPSFSPDGKYIIYSSARRDTNGDGKIDASDKSGIYILNLADGEEFMLVGDEAINTHPSISPDGRRVLFLRRNRDTNGDGKLDLFDNPEICIVDVDGKSEEVLVPDIAYNKFPSFSPDSKKVIFASWRVYNSGIYMIDLETKKEKQVVSDTFDNTFPSFSPDGKRVVYASWRRDTNGDGKINMHDNSGIYITDLSSEKEIQLASEENDNSFPAFSPDGVTLAFLIRRRDTNKNGVIDSLDNSAIYTVDISGRNKKKIVGDRFYNKFPCWSYDGRQIVFLGSSRNPKKDNIRQSGFFSNKGIYVVDVSTGREKEVLSPKNSGSRFPATSPVKDEVVYLSWHRNTNRGIYIANYVNLPDIDKLRSIIENNLK